MKSKTFTLPPKCRIGTVTIRETFGSDESEAVMASENNSSEPKDELINLSIIKVNGEPVLPGDSGFDKWPTKTRAVIKRYYNSVNDIRPNELEELILDAEENATEIVGGNVHTTYQFPKGSGLEFATLKEMMEEDERAASASGKSASELMISRCVVKTNLGGFDMEDLGKLNTRTRNILTIYWSGMNFVPEEELIPLMKAAEVQSEAVSDAAKPSVAEPSPSGSGSHPPADAASPSPSTTTESSAE